MGIFVYFHRKLFCPGLLQYFIHSGLILNSETLNSGTRNCYSNSCGLFLRDFVT